MNSTPLSARSTAAWSELRAKGDAEKVRSKAVSIAAGEEEEVATQVRAHAVICQTNGWEMCGEKAMQRRTKWSRTETAGLENLNLSRLGKSASTIYTWAVIQ